MSEVQEQAPNFEFVANTLCLDFANTVDDRLHERPKDLLSSYSALVLWSEQAHIVTSEERQQLLAEAARRPAEAESVLQRARGLREVIYNIFSAQVRGGVPEQSDLLLLNEILSESMARACIVKEGESFAWDWADKETALGRMLWVVARAAADMLTSEELSMVRRCAAEDCTWLFLDTSKNHSRRWCDMNNCGNRAKAGRHYKRKKQGARPA